MLNTINIKQNIHQYIRFYIKTLNKRQYSVHKNGGFTLIEVLVATMIMAIVVALAGSGLVAMLNQNVDSAAESNRRINLNRALDYISNEVRMAKSIQAPSSSIIPSGGTGVLQLTIPIYSCGAFNPEKSYTVVYYTYPSSGLWESPTSIKRYVNINTPVPDPTPCPTPTNTSALTPSPDPVTTTFLDSSGNLLVDGIQGAIPSPSSSSGCTMSGGNGFYACIYTDSKKVDLYLYGKISSSPSPSPSSSLSNLLQVKSTAVTRAK